MKSAFLHEDETKKQLADFILNAKRLSMDKECYAFEKEFASYQGRDDAVLFNSGGSANLALLQALKNLGRLSDGDKVAFSSVTWSTNVMPIIQLGLIPVAIDVDPKCLNVTSVLLAERLKDVDIKAFFITNALGFTGDLDAIRDLCDEKHIILLEDNCESLGTELTEGTKTGNFGLAATFSFYVAHHMSTIEGGMVCTDDQELAMMLRIARANGWDRNLSAENQDTLRKKHGIETEFQSKYSFYDLGFNLRPTEITGFLGRKQLLYVDEAISVRESQYLEIEKTILNNPDLDPLDHSGIRRLSTFAFPIVCKTAELKQKYVRRFEEQQVEIRPMIAGNMQNQPFYSRYVKERFDLPGADMLQTRGFYCGNYPELTEGDLEIIRNCLM